MTPRERNAGAVELPSSKLVYAPPSTSVSVMRDGLLGCWSSAADGDCTWEPPDTKLIFGNVDGGALTAQLLVLDTGGSTLSVDSTSAAVRLRALTVKPPGLNTFTDAPPALIVSAADREPELGRALDEGDEGYLLDRFCSSMGAANASLIEPAGAQIVRYHRKEWYGRDESHEDSDPEYVTYPIDSVSRLSSAVPSAEELKEALDADEAFSGWLQGLEQVQRELVVRAAVDGRLSTLDLYVSYHEDLVVERVSMVTTYTWETALGTVSGVTSMLISALTTGVAVIFALARKQEVKQEESARKEGLTEKPASRKEDVRDFAETAVDTL